MFSKKKRDVLGIISNCKSKKRINLAEKIAEGLNSIKNHSVNLQGGCFENTMRGRWWRFDDLIRNYKFFFAFENSDCKDYVTEKFFHHGIQSQSVPIVFGTDRKTYEKLAPGSSFIHVNDFENTEKLIDYLKYVLKNETEYNKYFEWRNLEEEDFVKMGVKYVSKSDFGRQGFCELCRKLWSEENETNVVQNLHEWWYGNYTQIRSKYTDAKQNGYNCK